MGLLKEWSEKMGEYTGTARGFSENLEAVEGVSRYRRSDVRGFRGLALRYGDHEDCVLEPDASGKERLQ